MMNAVTSRRRKSAKMIYLDNASTTQLNKTILAGMMPFLENQYGNPGSIHQLGFQAKEAISQARQDVAEYLGARPEQIIFTSSGSEANNLALQGIKYYLRNQMKTHIIVSSIEHHSTLEAVKSLERCGFEIDYVNPDHTGVVTVEAVRSLVQDNTGLVCVMYVNNELGSENQVEEIGALCRECGALFMSDAVQAAGTFQINVECMHCDLLTISSHKIHGPKGIGALYCRNPEIITPIIYGGAEQEFGLRGGTENVAGIVGFGLACKDLIKHAKENSAAVDSVKREFMKAFMQSLSKYGIQDCVQINADCVNRHGKILSLTFAGVDGETLLLMMDAHGICASAGSACNSTEQVPSYVLKAIGLSDEQARCTVRLSFSMLNLFDDMAEAAATAADCVAVLKGCSR